MFYPIKKAELYGPEDKNFSDAYLMHLEAISEDFKWVKGNVRLWPNRAGGLWYSYAKDRFKAHQPFIDRYDVCDEVLGATVVPLLALCLEGYYLGSAIYRIASCLTMNLGNSLDEETDSLTEALWDLVMVGIAVALSSYIFLKSWISLVTRPIMTVLLGFQTPQEARFVLGDDAESEDHGGDFELEDSSEDSELEDSSEDSELEDSSEDSELEEGEDALETSLRC